MRYRPFGNSGTAVSAISLAFDAPTREADVAQLIFTALELGVNCFEFSAASEPSVLQAASVALGAVERELILVSLRLGRHRGARGEMTPDYSPQALGRALEAMLAHSKLERLDLAMVEAPAPGEDALPLFQALERMRDQRRLGLLGVAGDGDVLDPHIDSARFEVVAMPFTITSGWVERNRLRRAIEQNLIVIGTEFTPKDLPARKEEPAAMRGIKRLMGKGDDADVNHAYDFLHRAHDWTAEQICLAYALTELALATIQIHPAKPDDIVEMASIPEREMPNGVPAMIEMARFSAGPSSKRA
ncbi:MAG: aldo/keto reductase [Caulobacteraceae bacterium]